MSILNKIIKKEEEEGKVAEEGAKIKAKSKKKEVVVKQEKKSGPKITPIHYFSIITRPHISEKAFDINERGQYVFVVSDEANKSEIAKAIENFYKVVVSSVNIVRVPNKPKRYKGVMGVKSGYKKAIVTLKKGSKIDIMEVK